MRAHRLVRSNTGVAPTETVNQQNEDHNWCWHAPYKYYAKGAVFEENCPLSKLGRTRNVDINKDPDPETNRRVSDNK